MNKLINVESPSASTRLLSVQQFAEIYQLHPNTVISYIKKRGMPHIRLPRGYRIAEQEAVLWLQTHCSLSS